MRGPRELVEGNRRLLAAAAALAVVVLVAALAVVGPGDFFLPEESTQVEEGPVGGEVLRSGSFVGVQGHEVDGTVALVRDDEGLALRFENYIQTQGPDVFVYVTPAGEPDESDEIGAGRKVRIDGGADGGESTKEGTFTQRLPDGVAAEDVGGVAVWCERFGVPFGYANLTVAG